MKCYAIFTLGLFSLSNAKAAAEKLQIPLSEKFASDKAILISQLDKVAQAIEPLLKEKAQCSGVKICVTKIERHWYQPVGSFEGLLSAECSGEVPSISLSISLAFDWEERTTADIKISNAQGQWSSHFSVANEAYDGESTSLTVCP